jgi:hypothetical protein
MSDDLSADSYFAGECFCLNIGAREIGRDGTWGLRGSERQVGLRMSGHAPSIES